MPRPSAIKRLAARRVSQLAPGHHVLCPYCSKLFRSEDAKYQHLNQHGLCNLAYDRDHLLTKLSLRPSTRVSNAGCSATDITDEPAPDDQEEQLIEAEIEPRGLDLGEGAGLGDIGGATEGLGSANMSWTDNGRTTEHPYVEAFPCATAGMPINSEIFTPPPPAVYLSRCGPFSDTRMFKIAEVLMRTGLTNAGRNIHLQSPLYLGNTPWKNNKALLDDIYKLLHGPSWKIYDIVTGGDPEGRTSFLFARLLLDVIRDLIGNPWFKNHIRYAPERQYTTKDMQFRIYGEMWSGDWWWRMQRIFQARDPFATIVPLIVFTDKTNLTTIAGGVQAYPVVVSIGNISKDIRRMTSMRATVLLGYLPVEDFKDIRNINLRGQVKGKLRHRAMEKLLEPLKEAVKEGVLMWCADGRQRRIYPILAAYGADSPEQHDMECSVRSGCPICTTTKDFRGMYPNDAPLRQKSEILSMINQWREGLLSADKLHENGLKPWWPFWAELPFVNLGVCFTPDLLHQLYKGIFWTHLMEWIKDPTMLGKDADARFKAMPNIYGMRHFTRGIYSISQWTGHETKEMVKQFLPVIADDLRDEIVGLVRALLDFISYAHSSRLTEVELEEMTAALKRFHELKPIIHECGLENKGWWNETIKLHMLSHYERSIREYGTPDGYSTETSEYLHIEFAKTPFRKTNKNRSFMQQIIKFIQRQEVIQIHRAYLEEQHGHFAPVPKPESRGDDLEEDLEVEEDRLPGVGVASARSVDVEDEGGVDQDKGEDEEDDHGVEDVEDAMVGMQLDPMPEHPGRLVAYFRPDLAIASTPKRQGISAAELINTYGASELIPVTTRFLEKLGCRQPLTILNLFNVYHKLTLTHPPPPFAPNDPVQHDIIRAYPMTKTSHGHIIRDERFDTILFLDQPDNSGIYRYRAGRVRVIFTLPSHVYSTFPYHLAYVELFTPFGGVNHVHGMHSTSHALLEGKRRTMLVPITDIASACHLAPRFCYLPEDTVLNSKSDLLSIGRKFHLNHYYSHHMRQFIEYWRHLKLTTG